MSTLSNAAKDAALNAWLALIDADAGPGYIKFYTNSGGAPGTLLGAVVANDPFGSLVSHELVATVPISDPSADATGTAAWARVTDNSGDIIIDYIVVSTSGGGGEIIVSDVNFTAGQPINITAFKIRFPT
ncbi:hypothetical protein [Xanthobacter flavus]|uniref:hypothetical protein n=1 Tax=Xanthobacter flavus TaxID=281 RepID=UPI003728670D